jgi:TonB family protein
MRLEPEDLDGHPVAGATVLFPIKFVPELLQPSAVVKQPDWLRRPNGEAMMRFFPPAATRTGGQAVLHCIVTTSGSLDNCKVTDESPPGSGIGAAALALSKLLKMRPISLDGLPTAGEESKITIGFRPPDR